MRTSAADVHHTRAMSIDPVVLFFLLGLGAGLARSDLRLPGALYESLTVVLLLAIGLKGGEELASADLRTVLPQVAVVVAMGCLLPLLAYPALRFRLSPPDAAVIAGHYGSVSVVTFAVATSFLAARGVGYESTATLFLTVLEIPALVVAIALARTHGRRQGGFFRAAGDPRQTALAWWPPIREILVGRSLVLLLGGLAIGFMAGPASLAPVQPLYHDLFKGILTLFLLEMGLLTATHVGAIRTHGWFLVAIGVGVPLAFSLVGTGVGVLLGLSPGGTTLLAVLAASASYIAAPASLRIAVPEANIGLAMGAVLGVTFPFNVVIGIPVYHALAMLVTG